MLLRKGAIEMCCIIIIPACVTFLMCSLLCFCACLYSGTFTEALLMENPGCHIPIQQHHGHHHQQSQQQHFNQKAQTLVLDGDIFQRWSQIGTSQGFTTDTDIARFLIQQ